MTTLLRGLGSLLCLGGALFCLWKLTSPPGQSWSPADFGHEQDSFAKILPGEPPIGQNSKIENTENVDGTVTETAEPVEIPADPIQEELIVIDPGHGGEDGGAVVGTVLEKVWALRIGLELDAELRKRGHATFLTRSTDVFLPLDERAGMANQRKTKLLVSIHLNTSEFTEVQGVETFYAWPKSLPTMAALRAQLGETPGFEDDRAILLGAEIQAEVSGATGTRDRGVKNRRSLAVLNATVAPAVLVECGFLTNAEERKNILSAAYRKTLVRGLADGIENYLRGQEEEPEALQAEGLEEPELEKGLDVAPLESIRAPAE